MSVDYYDRKGRPMDRDDWARKFEIWSYKTVQNSTIVPPDDSNPIRISTVWLGLDHSFGEGPRPLIFETMVFGGSMDQEMDRYATEAAALVGHQRMCKKVMEAME